MKIDPVELGNRALRWPYWQWRPRMLAIPNKGSDYDGYCTILDVQSDGSVCMWNESDIRVLTDIDGPFENFADLIPDFTDDATIGAFCVHFFNLVNRSRIVLSNNERREILSAFQEYGVSIELVDVILIAEE